MVGSKTMHNENGRSYYSCQSVICFRLYLVFTVQKWARQTLIADWLECVSVNSWIFLNMLDSPNFQFYFRPGYFRHGCIICMRETKNNIFRWNNFYLVYKHGIGIYTVRQKGCHPNFVNSWSICEVLSLLQRAWNFQQNPYQVTQHTLSMLLHYLGKLKNQKFYCFFVHCKFT